ncbi:hypothetical protein [Streptomyces fuscichromogenes]|uniref:Uncharacterized protein n=1 Tax=Streptomyces fuscichromogenes TaxID=1324013 RepID=A0A918CT89_9ACTN|nr:hypothetical protein [Streptomyces fuscichromogenes]GGN23292.1 hypothetical protein GCM10011578_055460 [Streptomyces fuscichromogenes]
MSRPCLRDAQHELSYADVVRHTEAVAEQMAERGVGEGDVVAVTRSRMWRASARLA